MPLVKTTALAHSKEYGDRLEKGRRRHRRLVASAGRASSSRGRPSIMYQPLTLVLVASAIFRIAESCSSRSTPKPRTPSPTLRPNVTFQTYACPPAYAAWYCLNGATCFTVKIGESILYNCECADGYMGQRCEFKDLDGSYLPSRERVMLETAGIASGATVAVLLVACISVACYIYIKGRKKDHYSIEKLASDLPFSGCNYGSSHAIPISERALTSSKSSILSQEEPLREVCSESFKTEEQPDPH